MQDFNDLVQEYYNQSLSQDTDNNISYSETYNEDGVIYNDQNGYSESCTPEELGNPW